MEKRLACLAVVRDYCERFRERITHFLKFNSRRLSKVKDLGFLDEYDRRTRLKTKPDDEGVYFDVVGLEEDDDIDDAAFWSVAATANGPYELRPADISNIDLHFPASFVDAIGLEAFIELVLGWCTTLKPVHGTAGLGTLFNQGKPRNGVGDLAAFPFIKRFPGLDYNDSSRWKTARREETGPIIRTTNWLTVLAGTYVEALGGREVVQDGLRGDCVLLDYDGGVVLRAGNLPQLGDANRGLLLDDYRTIARIGKPLRWEKFASRNALFAFVPEPLDNVQETLKWLRRFD